MPFRFPVRGKGTGRGTIVVCDGRCLLRPDITIFSYGTGEPGTRVLHAVIGSTPARIEGQVFHTGSQLTLWVHDTRLGSDLLR